MVAATTSTTIQRGADWDFSFSIREDGCNSPCTDLTDWIVTPTITNISGASIITPSIVRPSATVVSLRLTNTQTAALSVQFGVQVTVNVQRPDGWDMRLIQARASIV